MARLTADDSPDALRGAGEPLRAAYVSDEQPVMPPLPPCCPRCRNLIMTVEEDSFCYACGWHHQPYWPGADIDTRKIGAQLPVVMSAWARKI